MPYSKLIGLIIFLICCPGAVAQDAANTADTGLSQIIESEKTTDSSNNIKPLEISTEQEDINITYDRHTAKQQVQKYPDHPEAHFVLAVALTRTSQIEEAFKEIRIARRLAEKEGGPSYFDHMINEYENMLTYYPDDNRVRYHLSWAYYMKAYLLAEYSKRVEKAKQATDQSYPQAMKAKEWHKQWVDSISKDEAPEKEAVANQPAQNNQSNNTENKASSDNKPSNHLRAMEQVLRKAAPWAVPKIKQYYSSALRNLDELLAKDPKDVWARLYRAHLNAEYTGDLESAMQTWQQVSREHPTNPAAYFFLGEGYLKMGNLRKCLTNVSKAVALRAVGN